MAERLAALKIPLATSQGDIQVDTPRDPYAPPLSPGPPLTPTAVKHKLSFLEAFILFTGLVFFVVVTATVLASHYIFDSPAQRQMYPVFEGLMQFLFFGWLWSVNVYVFEKFKIDNIRLFGFHVHTALDCKLIAVEMGTLSIVLGLGIAIYTSIRDTSEGNLWPASAAPLVTFVIFGLFLCLPYGTMFWRTRLVLLKNLLQCFVAPLFEVHFVNVVIGDVLTSTGVALYDIEYSVCIFFSGQFLDPPAQNGCVGGWNETIMKPVIYALPFWFRLMQCLRRYYTCRQQGLTGWQLNQNLVNAGKYLSALMVVVSSSLHEDQPGDSFWDAERFFWLFWVVVKTVYCFVWDVRMDWDLGHMHSRNKGLRRKLIYKRKRVYYAVLLFNLLARCSWSFTLSYHHLSRMLTLILQLVEIARRFVWLFFRLENEALKTNRYYSDDTAMVDPVAHQPYTHGVESYGEHSGLGDANQSRLLGANADLYAMTRGQNRVTPVPEGTEARFATDGVHDALLEPEHFAGEGEGKDIQGTGTTTI